MSDNAILVENLGKLYKIGQRERHCTMYDRINSAITAASRLIGSQVSRLFGFNHNASQGKKFAAEKESEENNFIWALKNVSFNIKSGEVIGIIGRNGAGKSTLLKVLSRITEPTEGIVVIQGRAASLLEVGTGFHPELTGRENIYLNGAILGMRKSEIRQKFEEIVSFAEVDKFIDTPVKHYSSGMYVRLAFGIAAHLDPEILLVDEVLAVGDISFQKKCLGKMSSVAKEGRTVLFVSHNIGMIDRLCSKVIYLDRGQMLKYDDTEQTIAKYVDDASQTLEMNLDSREDRQGTGLIRAVAVRVRPRGESKERALRVGEAAVFEIDYQIRDHVRLNNVTVALGIDDLTNTRIVTLWSKFNNEYFSDLGQAGTFTCEIPRIHFRTGSYLLHVYVDVKGIIADYVHNASRFSVDYGKFYESGLEPQGDQGVILQEHRWSRS